MPEPGAVVPALTTADPWSPLEAQRLAVALRATEPIQDHALNRELFRYAGDQCRLDVYRASRSFRWWAEPGTGPPVGGGDALTVLREFAREAGEPLVNELALAGAPALRATGSARASHRRHTYTAAPGGMGVQQVGEATSLETTFAWEETPLLNARLALTVVGDRLSSIDLLWNRPLGVAGTVPTLTLPELDDALRCKGLGSARWAAPPRIVYRVGYPHLSQRLLTPLYRLSIHVRAGRRDQVAFVDCTAFRAGPPPLHPRVTTAPFLGDVLAL